MDAQTLAKTIKQRTKRGEWWVSGSLRVESLSNPIETLVSREWLERRPLIMDEPLRKGTSARFAYRWTDAKVPQFHV